MSAIFLIVGALFILSLIPLVLLGTRSYMRYRGTRVVTCPETQGPAAVRLDVAHATKTASSGEMELRVRSCSRWPEVQACSQRCLEELASAPAECLIKTTLVEWYQGSTCALCGRDIGEVHWVEHKPALLTPGRETVEWNQVQAGDASPPSLHAPAGLLELSRFQCAARAAAGPGDRASGFRTALTRRMSKTSVVPGESRRRWLTAQARAGAGGMGRRGDAGSRYDGMTSEEPTREISASAHWNGRVSNALRGPLTGLSVGGPAARAQRS